MGSTASKTILVCFFVIAFGFLALAQPEPSPTPAGHAPMELFGMGPEMFSNRGLAWVKAISEILTALIGTVGVVGLAALAVVQNLRKQAISPEVKERIDRIGQRVDNVALAVDPALVQANPQPDPEKTT